MAGPGVVQRLRAAFERLIRSHQPEPDAVLINRTLRNSNELVRQGRTYAEQLRMAQHFTLANLPESLMSFVLDHENLHRATVRSGQDALVAINSPNMDVFTRVAHRILHLRLVYHLQSIRETRNLESRIQITQSPSTERELRECTALLTDEIFRILLRLELVLPSIQSSYASDELENIGPDHDIADFGTELALRPIYLPNHNHKISHHTQEKDIDMNDATYRCVICLDPYHPTTHPAFQIAQCAHIVGKTCLATWLNSTAHNANCCPHCRAVLCERRARRPKPSQSAPPTVNAAEQVELTNRLERALNLVEDVDRLVYEIFGGDEEGEEGLWTDNAIMELNQRLFEEGVEFGFARDGFEEVGWRVRRVDWAAVEV